MYGPQFARLPELVELILQHLEEDISTLASCALVNTVWYQEAVSLLWSSCPGWKLYYLSEVSDQERRAMLASKIRDISFEMNGENCRIHPKLLNMAFPKLRSCDLGYSNDWNKDEFLGQYFVSGLRRFGIKSGKLSREFWMSIPTKCPALEEIKFGCTWEGYHGLRRSDAESMLEFLQACPNLKSIDLQTNYSLDQAGWRYLATNPKLEHIILKEGIDRPSDLPLKTPLFTSLISLTCGSRNNRNFATLLPHLTRLKSLELNVDSHFLWHIGGSCFNPLPEITMHCTNLEKLTVVDLDNEGPRLEVSDIISIATRLKSLTELELSLTYWITEASDATIAELAGKLPQLRRFVMSCTGGFTTHAFLALAKYCKLLETLIVNWSIGVNLLDLEMKMELGREGGCLFPKLSRLDISQIRTDGIAKQDALDIVRRAVPRLKLCLIMDDTDGDEECLSGYDFWNVGRGFDRRTEGM